MPIDRPATPSLAAPPAAVGAGSGALADDDVPGRVERFLRCRGLLDGSRPEVVVACSGGPDSLALLLSLGRLPLRLFAVYVDHGLRAGTAEEAALVGRVARRLGADHATACVQVAAGGNLMAAARAARYGALVEQARARGAALVVVGHTVTDQAETVALRNQRGDQPAQHALAGMPIERPLAAGVRLLRPLLGAGVTRPQARALVQAHGIDPVDDPSNALERFARVRVRRALAAAGEEVTRALLHRSAIAADALARDDGEALALGSIEALEAVRVAAARPEVVLRLLREAGAHHAGLPVARAVIALAGGSGGTRAIDVGGGLVAERSYQRLRIGPRRAPPLPPPELEVPGPGSYRFLDRLIEVQPAAGSRARAPTGDPPSPLERVVLRFPALLRGVRPGDRLPTRAGRRKLQDLLVDRKVPRWLRPSLAVLAPAAPSGTALGVELYWAEGLGAAVEASAASAPTMVQVRVHFPTENPGSPAVLEG